MTPQFHHLKNGQTVTIRMAQPADASRLIDFVHKVSAESDFLTMMPGEFSMTPAQEASFLQDNLDADNKIYMVAMIDDEVAGTCNFAGGPRRRTRHAGEFGMSVRKSHWGQGMGRLILTVLIDWAKSTGFVSKINLRVRTDNARAITLYENLGFVHEGTLRNEFLVDGRSHDLYWMGMVIPENVGVT